MRNVGAFGRTRGWGERSAGVAKLWRVFLHGGDVGGLARMRGGCCTTLGCFPSFLRVLGASVRELIWGWGAVGLALQSVLAPLLVSRGGCRG
jgi:hypothetical protein